MEPADRERVVDAVVGQIALLLVDAWRRANDGGPLGKDGGSFLRVLAALPRSRLPGWARREVAGLEVALRPGPVEPGDVGACMDVLWAWVQECQRRVDAEHLRLELARASVQALRGLCGGP